MNTFTTPTTRQNLSDDRIALVRAVAHVLESDGWAEIRAQYCPEYRDPQPVVVPHLNLPLQPDLCASHPARPAPFVACVGVAAELREPTIGRRWQALAAWATNHRADFGVFVQARDYARAQAIATRWHIDIEHLHILPPMH